MILNNNLKRKFGSFGFFFDIDGVFVKGKHIIPAATKAFKLLLDRNGRWKIPCVFVTNAGNKLRKKKAEELSEKFKIYVSPDQVVMSHSPLRMYTQFHKKKVLVCGQGPAKTIAQMLGFKNIVTVEDIKCQYPKLDVCDHDRPKPPPCAFEKYNKPVEAIILFGEPTKWESNYQILLDMLMTNGQPYKTVVNLHNFGSGRVVPYPHIPLLACNMDMMWMSDAPLPRIGHGCFLNTLETLYEKFSGRKLYYTALIGKPSELTYHYAEYRLNKFAHDYIGWSDNIKRIYCVGDNPQTDIYGANLYNRYLESQHGSDLSEDVRKIRQMVQEAFIKDSDVKSYMYGQSRKQEEAQVISYLGGTSGSSNIHTTNSSDFYRGTHENLSDNINLNITQQTCSSNSSFNSKLNNDNYIIKAGFADSCHSILVLTGVVRKDKEMDIKSMVELMSQSNVNHNHRDFPNYPELKNPTHICDGVDEAVSYVFERENFPY